MQLMLFRFFFTFDMAGASEASSKWVGKTKKFSKVCKKWVGKLLYSIKIRQKSGWARAHPAHPAPTPLYGFEFHMYEPADIVCF